MELLLDNSAMFRSRQLNNLCEHWGVHCGFQCTYHLSGNSIVECNHQTIKSLAAYLGKSPLGILFWYNSTPLDNGTMTAVALHIYQWWNPDIPSQVGESYGGEGCFAVGNVVFVKPAQMQCTMHWPTGIVTAVPSTTHVEVDSMPSMWQTADWYQRESPQESGQKMRMHLH